MALILSGVLVVLGVLAGCTTVVEGSPRAAEKIGLAAVEPCEMIPDDWLPVLELQKGEYTKADEQALRPHGCRWAASDEMISYGDVEVIVSPELSVDDWMQGAPFSDEVELGGLTWQVRTGAAGIEGDCGLVVALSETSFVDVSSVNYNDPDRACDKAKEVAPIIAGRLPGGEPVDAAPPTEVDPLADTDPCGLINPAQAEKLGYHELGEKGASGDNTCVWSPAESGKQDGLEDVVVIIESQRAVERQFPEKPDDELSVNGGKWLVFDAPSGTLGSCYVATNTSKRSHVRIFSSSRDRKKSGVVGKKAAPEVSMNLPEPS
ncbi:MAG: DUF3558 domain-containing protein [Actinophytocola sp.]|nr:DUF3558 domain-containing protein [Actinophytocola sp.]